MTSQLRIVIAEDAAIMRDGLTQTLTRRGHDVVAAVGDAAPSRGLVVVSSIMALQYRPAAVMLRPCRARSRIARAGCGPG